VKGLNRVGGGASQGKKLSLAERAKYQFEADSEDEGMEEEIDNNLVSFLFLLWASVGETMLIMESLGYASRCDNSS